MESDATPTAAFIGEIVKYAKGEELVLAAIDGLALVTERLDRIVEVDPELAPELRTALEQVKDLSATVRRMALFMSARYDAATERFNEA